MNSLRARVGIATALILATFIALTALALEQAFEKSAASAMRERLFGQLYVVMSAAEVSDSGMLAMPAHLAELRLEQPGSGLYARIGRPDGTTLWQSPSAVGITLPAPAITGQTGEIFSRAGVQEDSFFQAAMVVEWESDGGPVPLLFSVAENPAPFAAQMREYRTSLWGWLGAMALLLLAALVAALAWGLRPLSTVAEELRAVEAGKQDGLHRVYPQELQGLTDNINTLLHHERAQQVRYKNALADLAHSLKTPLAVLRGLVESKCLPLLDEQVARMDSIVQYQLQRAATAGRSALMPALPVAPTLERILTTLAKVYRERSLHLERDVDKSATFRGDEGDLMELLGNLLDNAHKWARSTIRIHVQNEGGELLIRLEDDGPGINETQVGQVLARGGRLDEGTPGHGIGLAMVRDIVEAYEGRLSFDRSPMGGASITLQLPG